MDLLRTVIMVNAKNACRQSLVDDCFFVQRGVKGFGPEFSLSVCLTEDETAGDLKAHTAHKFNY